MIHPATEPDIPALAEMLCYVNALNGAEASLCFGLPASVKDIEDAVRDALSEERQVLIYRTEGVARACLMWAPAGACANAPRHAGRLAVLEHVHVEPIWRRRGLGGRLLDRFEREIAGVGCRGWITRELACNMAAAALLSGAGARASGQVFQKRFQTPA